MTLVFAFDETGKLISCELIHDPIALVLPEVENRSDTNVDYRCVEIDDAVDNPFVNACLNDPDHVKLVNDNIVYDDYPSEDPHHRAIPMSEWKIRVRPALMRAATTTNLFNN
jgi:hypothetical protein